MDEITMYAALQPEDESELSLDAARRRLAREIAAPARPRARRRMLLAAGAIAAAAAVVIAIVQAAGPGRSTGQFVTAAWVVKHNANGTFKVTLKQARDAAGLQRALRADGIVAYVRIGPWATNPSGPVTSWPAEDCYQAEGGPPVPEKVFDEVFPFPAGGDPDRGYAVTIRPSAIPKGDSILIQVTWTQDDPSQGIDVQASVMSTTRPPVCSPARD